MMGFYFKHKLNLKPHSISSLASHYHLICLAGADTCYDQIHLSSAQMTVSARKKMWPRPSQCRPVPHTGLFLCQSCSGHQTGNMWGQTLLLQDLVTRVWIWPIMTWWPHQWSVTSADGWGWPRGRGQCDQWGQWPGHREPGAGPAGLLQHQPHPHLRLLDISPVRQHLQVYYIDCWSISDHG